MSREKEDYDKIIARQGEEIRLLREENALLRNKVDAILRMHFGSKSEKLDPAQLELLLNPEEAKKPDDAGCEEDAPVAELKRELRVVTIKKPRQPRLPKNIRKVEEVITPKEVLENPEKYRKIGERLTSKRGPSTIGKNLKDPSRTLSNRKTYCGLPARSQTTLQENTKSPAHQTSLPALQQSKK